MHPGPSDTEEPGAKWMGLGQRGPWLSLGSIIPEDILYKAPCQIGQ